MPDFGILFQMLTCIKLAEVLVIITVGIPEGKQSSSQ